MSLKIQNKKGIFDLQKDFSIEIEDTSPVYNERGSQSIAATMPASSHNLTLTEHIHRLDTDHAPTPDDRVVVSDGVYSRVGKMNITQADKSTGIVSNIGFDESEVYAIWDKISLRSLENLPTFKNTDGPLGLAIYLNEIMIGKRVESDYAIFPICVAMPSTTNQDKPTYYPEYLNRIFKASDDPGDYSLYCNRREETYLINNDPVLTSVPEGYGITPFLKVSWILDFIFHSYGYTVVENPFTTHPQLSRLVVLNNTADCCVKGILNYADLMPDCTINEFLQALYCRFGMIYFINGKTKTVKLKFIKDIITAPASQDWTLLKAASPIINYNTPQQLKLSANTSISGPYQSVVAAPSAESLDKFLKPYDYIVSSNYNKGYLYYSNYNGVYTVRNIYTKNMDAKSSDFFPWDKGANIGYMEVSSVDECLPMKGSYPDDGFVCPAYLLGKVHRYTNIASADIELDEKQETKTPLCFCFAMPKGSTTYPFGSPRCYGPDGSKPIVDSNENTYDISMTFVGENGLFNRFWKGFDAILRHANHTIEASLLLTHNQLLNFDFSDPISMDGQRLLIDNQRYTLPLVSSRPSTVYLRSLKLLKPYDLETEQTVKTIEQKYMWNFHNDRDTVVDQKTWQQVEAWKNALIPPAQWLGVIRKNESSDPVSDIEIPFTVPTQEDYENKQEYFIKKINYSFDLYYKVRVVSSNTGIPIYEDKEYGGVHYEVQYNLVIRAESIVL